MTTSTEAINAVLEAGHDHSPPLSEIQAIFHKDGFLRLNGILQSIDLDELHHFSEETFRRIFERLYQNGHTTFPTHKREDTYALGPGVKNGFREIVMRSPGRYELSLLHSMQAPACVEHLKHNLLAIVPLLLEGCTWDDVSIINLSLVVSTPGSPVQPWHADGGHVNLQKHLPCHVLNVFVPLHDIALELGPTEIRPGTHYHTRNLAPMMMAAACRKTLRPRVAPILSATDVLIFDYRVLHRGLANSTANQNRTFLVLTVAKPWFKDILNFPSKSLDDPATTGEVARARHI
jgi:hypothetical protein